MTKSLLQQIPPFPGWFWLLFELEFSGVDCEQIPHADNEHTMVLNLQYKTKTECYYGLGIAEEFYLWKGNFESL